MKLRNKKRNNKIIERKRKTEKYRPTDRRPHENFFAFTILMKSRKLKQ